MAGTRIQRLRAGLLSSTAVVLGGLVAAGCAHVLPYQPRNTLVYEIGLEATKNQLFDLFHQNRIRRARAPVLDQGFMSQFIAVRVYSNGLFDYIGVAGRPIRWLRLRLPSAFHAQQYADALMSLHAYVFGETPVPALTPPPTQPAPPPADTWPKAEQPGLGTPGEQRPPAAACSACSALLAPDDSFCSSCGAAKQS